MDSWYRHGLSVWIWTHGIDVDHGINLDTWCIIAQLAKWGVHKCGKAPKIFFLIPSCVCKAIERTGPFGTSSYHLCGEQI